MDEQLKMIHQSINKKMDEMIKMLRSMAQAQNDTEGRQTLSQPENNSTAEQDSTGDDIDEDEDLTVFNDDAGEADSHDDSDDDCNCDDNAVVESDPVPADSKSTSELGNCAVMEEQLKLVNQKSDVIVYEVKNDAHELFDESHKNEKLQVTAIESDLDDKGEGAVDALGGFLIDSGCVSDAIEVPGATIPPEPPDTLHIIAALTDNILNLPTYPNSLQYYPAYSVVAQYFVDVDDIVPQKVFVHKDLIQNGAFDDLLALDLGKQVHTCVIINKVEFDFVLGSALINMFGKGSDIDGVKYAYCLLNVGGSIIVNKFLNGAVGPKTIHIPIAFDPGGIQRSGIAVQLGCGVVVINDFASNYVCQSLPIGGVNDSGFEGVAELLKSTLNSEMVLHFVDIEQDPLKMITKTDNSSLANELMAVQKLFDLAFPGDAADNDYLQCQTTYSVTTSELSTCVYEFIDLSSCMQDTLVVVPTLNGWLLGYPVVYLFSRNHISDAIYNLSTQSLRIYRLLISRNGTCSTGSRQEELMSFSVPSDLSVEGLAMRYMWESRVRGHMVIGLFGIVKGDGILRYCDRHGNWTSVNVPTLTSEAYNVSKMKILIFDLGGSLHFKMQKGSTLRMMLNSLLINSQNLVDNLLSNLGTSLRLWGGLCYGIFP